MFAIVRNRRGVIAAVEPSDDTRHGRLHLVHLEYKDDQLPVEERLFWELEPRGRLLEPNALPDATGDPMPPDDFDALVRAARWTSASPFLDPDGQGPLERLPISSPFHGAVQVEDFQLVPLLKALAMPRVNLLIADDVGLGKTIEAGLILSELFLRRRIQRVLILTPASLRSQWRDEMWEKFALTFDLVDRGETVALRRRLGMDANPWRAFSRIIASYHYLRQSETTPLWGYYQPILRAIAAAGGECARSDIEVAFEKFSDGLLRPGDRRVLAGGRERWQVMIRRARKPLKTEGWIAPGAGTTWKITEAGRQTADRASSGPAK